ncbi:MAG TPA: hypothetical protein VFD70_19195 [Anaerolineae bacterium]|nr:hypothetical protein [Anaerolineae bacterium]
MNRLNLVILAGFVVAALAVGWVFRFPLITDDPYITYRYALNLIQGNGFVFNAGERVLSTTTPLYALALAIFGLAYRDIPTLGYWLSVLSYGVAAYLVYTAAASVKMRAGGIVAGALLILSPASLMTFGLETGFYLMLALAALRAYWLGRMTLTFALAALLTLTRNDGAILVVILAVHYLWTRRDALRDWRSAIRDPHLLRPFLVYLLILAPWLIFSLLYFGSAFPATLSAKIAQAQSGLWDSFAAGFVKWLGDNLAWIALVFAFTIVGSIWAIRQRSLLLLAGVWAIAHVVAYSILGVAFYAWYVAPLIPALVLFAGIGVELVAQGVTQFSKIAKQNNALKIAVMTACGAVLLFLQVQTDIDVGMVTPSPKVEAYQRAAEWLARNTAVNASVDALEVGVIGYYDGRRTVDFVGLVDPQQLPYLREQKFADGVRRTAADYVIAIPPDTWLPNDGWFKNAYHSLKQLRVPGFYSNKPLVIYQRSDVGLTPIETRAVNAAFEKRIELTSVELFAREVQPDETLPLHLNLRTLTSEPVPDSWKFTLQLIGAENRIIAQTDNFFPLRLPARIESFQDIQGIPIPSKAPLGEYDFILAMYDVNSNERLSLYDANGTEVGDFVDLGKIRVTP